MENCNDVPVVVIMFVIFGIVGCICAATWLITGFCLNVSDLSRDVKKIKEKLGAN